MTRIVILSVPAYGHINPVLPIAAELVRRGHDVTIFNDASFESLITPTGARFAAYPPGVIALEDFSRTLRDGDFVRWIEMLLSATAPLLRSTFKALRRNPPDVLAFDGIAIWGEMLASKLKVPSVSISTSFSSDGLGELIDARQLAKSFASLLVRLPRFIWAWNRMALSGIGNLPWRLPLVPRQGDTTLMLTSKAVHPRTRTVAKGKYVFVGSSIEPSTRLETFDYSKLDGRPLLYVSLGTLHHGKIDFFERCMEAFKDYPGQVLVSVGRGTDLSQFAGAPSNFIFAESVPQLDILDRTRVFITHAGLNSMHEGLWAGVPMVAVPQQFEQLNNARAMATAGAGVVLDAESWGRTASPAELRAAVDTVEADHAAFASAAADLGKTLRTGGGYKAAADRIEQAAIRRSVPVQDEAVIDAVTRAS